MTRKLIINLTVALVLLSQATLIISSEPFSAFLYQGRLEKTGQPATGRYDFRFRLAVVQDGSVRFIGNSMEIPNVEVTEGNFAVDLDFGPGVFDGGVRELEIAVRVSGTGSGEMLVLSPRQRIKRVPEASHADTASQLIGLLSTASLPANVARLDLPQTYPAPPLFAPTSGPPFNVGVTVTVQRLSADLLDGLDSTAFWRRETNDGVSRIVEPEDRPLEIRVQNTRVLRLQKGDSNLGWSVVGGSAGNNVAEGVPGAVVGGGRGNQVETGAFYSSVLGGDGNTIGPNAYVSTIGGGARQLIGPNSVYAGIFAGYNNMVSSNSRFAGILLGNNGKVRENSDFAAVLSGGDNTIGPGAGYAVIAAGSGCRIEAGGGSAFIGGGQANVIRSNSASSAILSGAYNSVEPGAQRSILAGGSQNQIGPASYNAFLGGGDFNKIEFNAHHASMLGGQNNLVRSNAAWATVLGGANNVAGAPFSLAGGQQAKAEHSGSIVFADASYADFPSTRANEFAVRAGGGARFETGGAGLTLDGKKITGEPDGVRSAVLRATTTGATPTELFVDGVGGRLKLPANALWTFDILVAAKTADGSLAAGYQARGVIQRDVSNKTAFVGKPTVAPLGEIEPGWDVQLEVNDAEDALVIRVTGSTGATVRWVATMQAAESSFF